MEQRIFTFSLIVEGASEKVFYCFVWLISNHYNTLSSDEQKFTFF